MKSDIEMQDREKRPLWLNTLRRLCRGWLALLALSTILITIFIPKVAHSSPLHQGEEPLPQADALYAKGGRLAEEGRLDEALEIYEQALLLYDSNTTQRASSMVTLTAMARIQREFGRYEAALDLYEMALVIADEIEDLDEKGALLHRIGLMYYELAQYDVALTHYQEALTLHRAIGDREGEGISLSNIGGLYDDTGRREEALPKYEAALAIARELGNREAEARRLAGLGAVYDNLSEGEKALEIYAQALTIAKEIGHRSLEGTTLNSIGFAYSGLGRLEQAAKSYEQALEIRREVNDLSGELVTLSNLATLYDRSGHPQAALDAYEQALAIAEAFDNPVAKAGIRLLSGRVYLNSAQYEIALRRFQSAIDIAQEYNLANHAVQAQTNLGAAYHHLGRLEEALDAYQQAHKAAQKIGNSAIEAIINNNIGNVYEDLGDLEQALTHYQQLLELSRESGYREFEGIALSNLGHVQYSLADYDLALETFQEARDIIDAFGQPGEKGKILNNIGMVYFQQRRADDALDIFEEVVNISGSIDDQSTLAHALSNLASTYLELQAPDKAIDYYKRSINVTEATRNQIRVDENQISFNAIQTDGYEDLISLLWQEGRTDEAFEFVQRAKAYGFLEQMGNQRIEFRHDGAADLIETEQALVTQIRGVQSVLLTEQSKPIDRQEPEWINRRIAELESLRSEYSRLIERIKLENPEYGSLTNVTFASVEDIQSQTLDGRSTLIEYFVMDDTTLAWVIDDSRSQAVNLDISRSELANLIEFMRDMTANQDFDAEIAESLYKKLILPLKPYLDQPNLIIMPHGPLHYLPFSALLDPVTQSFLVEESSITYAPNASMLNTLVEKRGANQNRILALGNPDRTLPSAATEAKQIAQLYRTAPLIHEEATESQVYAQANQIDVLHLAAHGVYNPFNPLFTRIELAPDDQHDGNLEVHEVYGLDLIETDLVVLSACDTALGDQSDGDEIVGLTRAFLYAGSSSVMTTLWRVDDDSTAVVMARFHAHILDGKPVAEALRQAKIDGLKRFPNPYLWAAFTLHGDGGWSSSTQITDITPAAELEQNELKSTTQYWLYQFFDQIEFK